MAEGRSACFGVLALKTRGSTSSGLPCSTSRREPRARKLQRAAQH